MKKKLPKFLQPMLWSYKLESLDKDKDKEYIITQVLNYGDWRSVKWVKKAYSDQTIKNIVLHPRRGQWFERVLNFWTQMFNIKIDPKEYKKAILDINPDYDYELN